MSAVFTFDILCPLDIAMPGKAVGNTSQWINSFSLPMYIFMGYIWVGVSMGDKGDVSPQLLNVTQNINYRGTSADHYIEIGEKEYWIPNMAPHYFLVQPNDVLQLSLIANADAGTPLVAQAYAQLYYTLTP